jgi:hypothetical protein
MDAVSQLDGVADGRAHIDPGQAGVAVRLLTLGHNGVLTSTRR